MGLHEGICNHLSFMVPGRDDLFLVNPDGWSFAEITASRLLICDFHRTVVAGDGVPEDTAFYIHARLHARIPRARAAFHTHMPNATALCMVEGEPLVWAGQSALKFYGRTKVDETYNGLALDESEGDRIADSVGRCRHRLHEASRRAGPGGKHREGLGRPLLPGTRRRGAVAGPGLGAAGHPRADRDRRA